MKKVFEKTSKTLRKLSPTKFSRSKKRLINELRLIIETSPSMIPGEKEKILELLPLFKESTLNGLRKTFIREGLRFIKKHHGTT